MCVSFPSLEFFWGFPFIHSFSLISDFADYPSFCSGVLQRHTASHLPQKEGLCSVPIHQLTPGPQHKFRPHFNEACSIHRGRHQRAAEHMVSFVSWHPTPPPPPPPPPSSPGGRFQGQWSITIPPSANLSPSELTLPAKPSRHRHWVLVFHSSGV